MYFQSVSRCLSRGIESGTFFPMLEAAQIRAARALLGWRQEDLSRASGVGTATIQRIEKSHRPITGYVSTLVRIQAALEQAGIQFIAEDEMGGVGLRMAKKTRKR
jgi:transcriptional regulator with XRE-family HTH domain